MLVAKKHFPVLSLFLSGLIFQKKTPRPACRCFRLQGVFFRLDFRSHPNISMEPLHGTIGGHIYLHEVDDGGAGWLSIDAAD